MQLNKDGTFQTPQFVLPAFYLKYVVSKPKSQCDIMFSFQSHKKYYTTAFYRLLTIQSEVSVPRLTQRLLPVHGLDVHQAWQVGAHRDGVGPGALVRSLDAAALPVRPVDVGPQQGQTVRVLDWSHKGATVLPIQVGRFDTLEGTTR